MVTCLPLLYRLAAAVLLAWFLVGAVAMPLTACCVSDEPCCAASPAGQGCSGCSTLPVIASAPLGVATVVPHPGATAAQDSADTSHDTRPWKPPD